MCGKTYCAHKRIAILVVIKVYGSKWWFMTKTPGQIINFTRIENIEQILIKILSIVLPIFLFINFTIYPFHIIYSRVLTLCAICMVVFLKFPISERLFRRFPWIKILDYLIVMAIVVLFIFFYQELEIFIDDLGFDTTWSQRIFTTLMMVIVFVS